MLEEWSPLVLDWAGVAVHIHTKFLQRPGDGRDSIAEVVRQGEALGLKGMVINDHTTDPGHPAYFSPNGPMAAALRRQVELNRKVSPRTKDLIIFNGIEVNIMPDGKLDTPRKILDEAEFVIASAHGGLGSSEKDPEAITSRLLKAASLADCLGHPTRYAYGYRVPGTDHWESTGVDWLQICSAAAEVGCAVEININQFRDYWKVPDATWKPDGRAWLYLTRNSWNEFLRALAISGAWIVLGFDIHSVDMWPTSAEMERNIRLFESLGIKLEKVINRTPGSFNRWGRFPRTTRATNLVL